MLERYRRNPSAEPDMAKTDDTASEDKTEPKPPLWRRLVKKLLIFLIRLAFVCAILLLAHWAYQK